MTARAKISCIGGGNMAAALLGGLLRAGWPRDALAASEPLATRRRELTKRFGVQCFAGNAECAARGEVVVLAVKPQIMREVTAAIAAELQRNQPLLISFAAGIRCDDLLRWVGAPVALVRAMPNTPALVGAGVSGMFANAQVRDAQRDLAQTILSAVGETLWISREELMDAVTAVSGCGPAYFFKMMELMTERAAEYGLSMDDAGELVMRTALGAAELARGRPPSELRRQVTSPGGTTEAALAEMETCGFDRAMQRGIDAARQRAAQLADEFGAA